MAELWDLLETAARLDAVWRETHEEADRVAMRAAWHLGWTVPGSSAAGREQGCKRCTATVLCSDTWTADDEMGDFLHYRGACLYCGWVGPAGNDENLGAEDAVDHAWPGWRELPVVEAYPFAEGQAAMAKKLKTWETRVAPLLPPGWLEAGGPIRTSRKPPGTRHVPSRTQYGGYDMAEVEAAETASGQLVLALDVETPVRRRAPRAVKQVARGKARDVVDVDTGGRL